MIIEINVVVDNKSKSYTVYKEELEQIVCNKAREDNPKAKEIFTDTRLPLRIVG